MPGDHRPVPGFFVRFSGFLKPIPILREYREIFAFSRKNYGRTLKDIYPEQINTKG